MKTLKRLPFALWALALWTLAATVASAQDAGNPPEMELLGPYRVAVQMTTLQPVQADARFYVYLLDDVTGQTVPEAQVRIRTINQATGQHGFAIALSRPQEPHIYTANVRFEENGVYDTAVEISSTLGTVTVAAPQVVVHFGGSSPAGGYVFLAVALVLVGGGLYLTWRIRQAQRQRGSSADAPFMARN